MTLTDWVRSQTGDRSFGPEPIIHVDNNHRFGISRSRSRSSAFLFPFLLLFLLLVLPLPFLILHLSGLIVPSILISPPLPAISVAIFIPIAAAW
jgi:hypothetical protein